MCGMKGFAAAAALLLAAFTTHAQDLQVVAEVERGPGNLTVTAGKRLLVSLHQFYDPEWAVAEWVDGRLRPFPTRAIATGEDPRLKLDTVLGIQADREGVVWMLDNAMRGGGTPKLVGWDLARSAPYRVIPLDGVAPENAFLNDLAVDRRRERAYIADPAGGDNAALIVVDLTAGTARRVLQGHESVTPEDVDLVIDDTPVRIKQPDGSVVRPRVGVNPIALDADNEWLYFGPMHGRSLYRIRADALADPDTAEEALADGVERYADKPLCDGISIDRDGNIYISDLSGHAVGVIGPDRQYRKWVEDPLLSWPDAFSFGPDGWLYTVANQLHRSAVLNGGESAVEPPFRVLRMEPVAPGLPGR